MNLCCSQCGHRQDVGAVCARCGSDTVHDIRSRRTRELFEDIEMRLRDRREGRIRAFSVLIGMGVIVCAWLVPAWWKARGTVYPGLPFVADQIIFMVIVALGAHAALDRVFTGRRFPFLESLPPAELP